MRKSILALALASTAALGACTANPQTNADIATGAAVGAAGGAVVGAVAPGISTIAGAAVGAAIGGLAGAVWADNNNDGYVDGYVYNGQYYAGPPSGYDRNDPCGRDRRARRRGARRGRGSGSSGRERPAGAVIGAAVGGLAGAIWADRNNDGMVDGYVYNGQYYAGGRRRCSGSGSGSGSNRRQLPAVSVARQGPRRAFFRRKQGDEVISLRNKCTGQRPVHSYKRKGGLVAAVMLGASAFLRPQWRALRRRRDHAGRSIRSRTERRRFLQGAEKALRCGFRRRRAMPRKSWCAADEREHRWPQIRKNTHVGSCRRRSSARSQAQAQGQSSGPMRRSRSVRRLCRRSSPGPGRRASPGSTRASSRRRRRRLPRCSTRRRRRRSSNYVANMGWMHPIYGSFARRSAEHKYSDDHQREILELNLEARADSSRGQASATSSSTPPSSGCSCTRTAKPVDKMVVVVGKTKWPTPMLAAYIRFAALNPYWYVPPDLAGEDVGQYVVKQRPQVSRRLWLRSGRPTGAETRRSSIPRRSTGRASSTARSRSTSVRTGTQELHGADQVHVPQRVRRLPARQSAAGAVQAIDPLFQRRLRAARGCVAAQPMAVSPRADVGGACRRRSR